MKSGAVPSITMEQKSCFGFKGLSICAPRFRVHSYSISRALLSLINNFLKLMSGLSLLRLFYTVALLRVTSIFRGFRPSVMSRHRSSRPPNPSALTPQEEPHTIRPALTQPQATRYPITHRLLRGIGFNLARKERTLGGVFYGTEVKIAAL